MRILLAFLLLMLAAPAQADYCASYGIRRMEQREWPFSVYRERYCRHWARSETRVYAYERRAEEEERWERRDPAIERGEHCKDETVRVVGGLHLTKEGALSDAVRQWQSTVRYDHGEKWMDIETARGYVWRCDRAGTNETFAGRVGEAISGGSGFQRRCVVMAKPCRMPVTRGDEDKR